MVMKRMRSPRRHAGGRSSAIQVISVAGRKLVVMEAAEYERLLDEIDALEAKRISEDRSDPVLRSKDVKGGFLRNHIAQVREKRGLSQKELASRLGVEQSVVSRWEGPNANLTIETLRRIAKALGCPVHRLIS